MRRGEYAEATALYFQVSIQTYSTRRHGWIENIGGELDTVVLGCMGNRHFVGTVPISLIQSDEELELLFL